jgi:hypothetical protein
VLPSHQRYLFYLKYTFFSNYKLDALIILIYDVNDGMWESKGNFETAKEDNDDIDIKSRSTDDGLPEHIFVRLYLETLWINPVFDTRLRRQKLIMNHHPQLLFPVVPVQLAVKR